MEDSALMKKIMFLLTILIGCIAMISGCKGESDVLSDDEIKRFNSEFFNGGTDNRNNMMLSSEYDRPENIDLFQLFYNGIGGVEDQVSEEEEALLAELNSEAPYLDIVKVTTNEMNDFLEEKLGIQLDETKKIGLENFYYLEPYDSFYLVVGDTNFDWCTVTSGIWKSDKELTLDYTKEYEGGQWRVVLEKTDNGYLFVSNEHVSIEEKTE